MRFAGSFSIVSASLLLALSAQAASPEPLRPQSPRKATAAEKAGNCDAYGPGFVRLQGSDTCIKVGGRVRVETWYTPGQNAVTQGTTTGR
ncbi:MULTISPECIES: porin [unclassified Beijerinckia]|uniref:porin n=1 Tax=unclassified Beijerinckia TaxID=2638183 RepID=UPI0008967643|nr:MULTISPECIES: porin [unclassified Beijerinckia]MDH7794616.1 hypothetical protein [Beijerinckia sp. GAS462]SEB68637.1 Porin subfamily protein [Beijerinckia sp. 28-YEA-48]